MKCFVTGASGFVGSNLVHELVASGHRVKALLRPNADPRGLAGVECRRVTGDLGDRELLKREMDRYEWCFHVAASYQLWMRNYAPMYATNVEGTRNVIEAAAAAGCLRIVYTSTVGCIALPKTVDGRLVPGDEMEPVSGQQMGNHYKRSKWQAECLAMRLARKDGLPVIIVNPSAPVGPRDVKPTPTGQMILDFLNRKMPGYVDSGLNWVSVRDVVAGHILAAEIGAIGERYILGNAQGNWTIKETFDTLAEISGVPAPNAQAAALGGAGGRLRERGHRPSHRPAAANSVGRGAHGQVQDVVQSGQGHPRTRPAANAGEAGHGGSRAVVPGQRLRQAVTKSSRSVFKRNWPQAASISPPFSCRSVAATFCFFRAAGNASQTSSAGRCHGRSATGL